MEKGVPVTSYIHIIVDIVAENPENYSLLYSKVCTYSLCVVVSEKELAASIVTFALIV